MAGTSDLDAFELGEIVGELRTMDREQGRQIADLAARVIVLEQRPARRLHAVGGLLRDNAAVMLRAPVALLIGSCAGILISHLHRFL